MLLLILQLLPPDAKAASPIGDSPLLLQAYCQADAAAAAAAAVRQEPQMALPQQRTVMTRPDL
jgi:hypothetical protein